jgi:hypothetical protein
MLPEKRSAAGRIYFGQTKALSMPLPIALLMAREFAYRTIDQNFLAQSSAAVEFQGMTPRRLAATDHVNRGAEQKCLTRLNFTRNHLGKRNSLRLSQR